MHCFARYSYTFFSLMQSSSQNRRRSTLPADLADVDGRQGRFHGCPRRCKPHPAALVLRQSGVRQESTRAGRQRLGYYIAVPPDPTDEEMKGVWATLRELTQDAAGPK